MYHLRLTGIVAGLASLTLLSGCIDEAYDLSDVDTTSRIDVKGLVIPVNIDKITLDDIIDLDENSKIKAVNIDGQEFYALTETGEFHSDPINIAAVTAPQPVMTPTQETLTRISGGRAAKATRALSPFAVSYTIKPMGDDFEYKATDVDKSIEALYSAKVSQMKFAIALTAPGLESLTQSLHFTDLRIQMPKGLNAAPSAGTYDPSTGIWTITNYESAGANASISLNATEIDFRKNDAILNRNDRTFTLKSSFKVLDGVLSIEPKEGNNLPSEITFRADYTLSPMSVSSISGRIDYRLEGMDIDPVVLSDIPDFLNGEGTNIMLSNPQIYLSTNNPLSSYGIDGNAGLTLTANRPDAPASVQHLSYSLDNGPMVIGHNKGTEGPYQFVLSPSGDKLNIPDGFSASALRHYSFKGLSDLLSVPQGTNAAGLPASIGITLSDPCVPSQDVADFRLGTNLPPFAGKYELVAPLDLKTGSVIIYTDTQDGWNDEDVDAIVIEELTLTALADNATPLSAELVAYPLDKEGNRIPDVKVESNVLNAGAQGAPIEIKLTGEIRHLDGVTFQAIVRPGENNEPLAPSQTIQLRTIRAKVTGYYLKKF